MCSCSFVQVLPPPSSCSSSLHSLAVKYYYCSNVQLFFYTGTPPSLLMFKLSPLVSCLILLLLHCVADLLYMYSPLPPPVQALSTH